MRVKLKRFVLYAPFRLYLLATLLATINVALLIGRFASYVFFQKDIEPLIGSINSWQLMTNALSWWVFLLDFIFLFRIRKYSLTEKKSITDLINPAFIAQARRQITFKVAETVIPVIFLTWLSLQFPTFSTVFVITLTIFTGSVTLVIGGGYLIGLVIGFLVYHVVLRYRNVNKHLEVLDQQKAKIEDDDFQLDENIAEFIDWRDEKARSRMPPEKTKNE